MMLSNWSLLEIFAIFVMSISGIRGEYYSNHSRDFSYLRSDLRSELQSLKRLPRFLTFQTLDDDLKVHLEFVVPFIHIPVKRTSDAASGIAKGMANVNIAALVLTGITVITGVSVASAFSHFGKMATGGMNGMKSGRSGKLFDDISAFSLGYRSSNGEKAKAPLGDIMSNIESMFRDYDVDITSCAQKVMCLLVHQSTENVLRGKGSSTNKIIDGLSSTNWLLGFISGTAIKEAIDVGKSGYECGYKYQGCSWSDSDIMEFIDTM